ncbi:MAG TPA: META domain-containing protein [Phnomibacter sp.]|nr:META domain-containing protein [Phnomibacter sp.]
MKLLMAPLAACLLLAACSGNKNTSKPETEPSASVNNKSLEGTYWILTELNGKSVSAAKEGEKPSFIYFDAGKKRVSVSGGCNVMGGSYELMDGGRIKFGQLMSTMMACPDMTNEDGLRQMTSSADTYAINGDMLSFTKARMAWMARFKAVAPPAGFSVE